jgi:hypothetical protein
MSEPAQRKPWRAAAKILRRSPGDIVFAPKMRIDVANWRSGSRPLDAFSDKKRAKEGTDEDYRPHR